MMLTKKEQRLRRARQTRIRISKQEVARLSVNRTNTHIYATLVSVDGATVLASAATAIGTRIAEKAKAAGVERVAFDRAGFAYHGRVKALAEAARAAGLQF
jgi:large subunit ribosomal protein L18